MEVITVPKDKQEEAAAPVESTYPRAELIANSQAIFRVMPVVVIGVLHGNNAQDLTISEVKKAIKEFLGRKAV
jgi:hypothetical protein